MYRNRYITRGQILKVSRDWECLEAWSYLHLDHYGIAYYHDGKNGWFHGSINNNMYQVNLSTNPMEVLNINTGFSTCAEDFGFRGKEALVARRTYIDEYDFNGYSVEISAIEDFNENLVSYNTRPNITLSHDTYQRYKDVGWMAFHLDGLHGSYQITGEGNDATFRSSEFPGYEPYIIDKYDKLFQAAEYSGFQTSMREHVGMRSGLISLDLQENDIIEINFESTSENQINLKLLSAGEEVYSNIIMEEDDPKLRETTIQFLVQEDILADQVEISGIIDDGEYFKIYHMKIIRHNIKGTEILNPNNQKDVYLEDDNYTVFVYENNIFRNIFTFTINGSQTTVLVFHGDYRQPIHVFFYNLNNDPLNFLNFKTFINYTLDGNSYFNRRLKSNSFQVDKDTLIQFDIYDAFDNLVKHFESFEYVFIDIVLEVYSLMIKNTAEEHVSYKLTREDSDIEKSGIIPSQELEEFMFSTGHYNLVYINHEDDIERSLPFVFDTHELITINTTYFEVYFGLYNVDGLGLDPDIIRFYINQERRDFGFNSLKQEMNHIKVLDYFNATLYEQEVNLREYTEYNVFVEVYNLILYNNYSFSVKLNIERNGIEMEQVIPSFSALSYRFLPLVSYHVRVFHLNGSLLDEQEIELESNNIIVSFGFYQESVPNVPEFNVDDTFLTVILIVLLFSIIVVVMIGIAYRYYRINHIARQNVLKKSKNMSHKYGGLRF